MELFWNLKIRKLYTPKICDIKIPTKLYTPKINFTVWLKNLKKQQQEWLNREEYFCTWNIMQFLK